MAEAAMASCDLLWHAKQSDVRGAIAAQWLPASGGTRQRGYGRTP